MQIINRYTYIFMKRLRISKIWIAMIVVIIVAVAAWLFSGSKNEEQIDVTIYFSILPAKK